MRTFRMNYKGQKFISSFDTFQDFKEYLLTKIGKEQFVNIRSIYEINAYGENEKRINFKKF
jgi:hypothetical protein